MRRAASRAACQAGSRKDTTSTMMAMTTSSSTKVNPALFVRDIGSVDSRKVKTLKPPTQAPVEASLVVPDRHCQSKSLQPAHYLIIEPLSDPRSHEIPPERV